MTIFIIILGIIFHIIIHNVVLCNVPVYYVKFNTCNNSMFQSDIHLQETESLISNDYTIHKFNIYPHTINKLHVYTRNHDKSLLYFFDTSKIQLLNDSIDVLHLFYKKNDDYQKTLSFMQLGIHNLLSEQVINLGLGKRHTFNHMHFFGYNAFYNCPISKQTNHPYSINLGIEYGFHNTLFMWNNYYNLNHFPYFSKSLHKYDIHNPKISYQLYLQTQFTYFPEFTGKIKLERFFYIKNYQKFFNKKNNNYCLSLGINYKPIPILSFDIDNIFINEKYDTVCKILINYQFGIPITQQINHKNRKANTSLISNHIDTILQPFVPTIIKYNKYAIINQHDDLQLSQHISKIIGYPGEIKIIKTNKNIQWNVQLLRNVGGNIIPISNNTYAISLPNHPITEENNVFITYTNDSTTCTSVKQDEQKIYIVVQDNVLLKKSLNTQKDNNSIINDNCSYCINTTDNTITNEPILNKNNKDQTHNTLPTILDNTMQRNLSDNMTTSHDSIIAENDFILPTPPPIPVSYFYEAQSSQQLPLTTKPEIFRNNNSPLSLSSSILTPPSLISNNDQTTFYTEIHDDSIGHENVVTEENIDNDLSHRLSIHKKHKFSSVGTIEHINKIENIIEKRKKTKHFSNIEEQILFKLRTTQSYSSINEDYTTDDSNDSFH